MESLQLLRVLFSSGLGDDEFELTPLNQLVTSEWCCWCFCVSKLADAWFILFNIFFATTRGCGWKAKLVKSEWRCANQ